MQSIFVSSTFRDMHYERDIIQTEVVPAVNSIAAKYGESISAFDLRWGVNTADMSEESSAKKVLDVCLNGIDRCRPYMIVILGYRYGWIPDAATLTEALRGKDNISFPEEKISVTALEIEYGALADGADLERTLFYFREIDGPCEASYLPEDEEHKTKLEALKARIQCRPGSHVKTYHVHYGERFKDSIRGFARMVTEDICALMRSEWEKNAQLNEYALDQIKQRHYLAEKESQFIARSVLLDRCLTLFRKQKKLVLKGVAGSGKSTLVSKIGHQLQQEGHHVIPIYCGYTKLCSSGFDILRYIVWELETELGINLHFCNVASEKIGSPAAWYEYYDLLMKRCCEQETKKITFLVDGIDQLIHDDIAQAFTYLPETQCDGVGFILSATLEEKLPVGYPCVEVGRLTLEERIQVVQGILDAKHRELPEPVIREMVLPKAAELPLFLNLMVHRLLMMNFEDFAAIHRLGDGIKAIEEYQITLIDQCPATLPSLAAYVTAHASSLVGGAMMKEAVKLIAASRRGLRLTDLEGMLKPSLPEWNTVDAMAYFQYLGTLFLYRKDGRIDFAHKSMREGIFGSCTPEQRIGLHKDICRWLNKLPLHDEIRMQEVVWHMIQADEKREFAAAAAEMSHNELNVSGMVKDIVDVVVADDSRWLLAVIRECVLDPSFPALSHMMNYHVFFGLVDTARNLQIKLKISEAMVEALQKRSSVVQTHGSVWDVTVACDRLSAVHLAFATQDHTDLALKCSRHSLLLREQLLEQYGELNTPETLREYFIREAGGASIQMLDLPNDHQLREMYRMLCNETRRGICVVCENMAEILCNVQEDRLEQALSYLLRSLELRQDMYRDNEGDSFVSTPCDEEVELSRLHGKIAGIHMLYDDEEHWLLAEKSCASALDLAQIALKKGKTPSRLEAWCAANIRYAELYMKKAESHEKALTFLMSCLPVLEKLNTQTRTVGTQRNLADLYNRLGNYYRQTHRGDGGAAAERYYQKSRDLMMEITQKCPSVDNLRSVVVVTQNQAQHWMNRQEGENRGGQRQEQMAASVILAYEKGKQLLKETGTKAACEQLNGIYDTVLRLVEAEDLAPNVADRLILELKACKLENYLEVRDLTPEDLRPMIVKTAKLSSNAEGMAACENAQIGAYLTGLLNAIDFRLERLHIRGGKRAYELLKVAFRLSEILKSKSDALEDLDIYAVTLAKYSGMCMQFSQAEWAQTNQKLLETALFLYRKTNREKYMQMLAMAEMGRKILGNSGENDTGRTPSQEAKPAESGGPFLPGRMKGGDRVSQIKKRIAELEEELKLIPGFTNILRKKKLEQQIEALKRELEDLSP